MELHQAVLQELHKDLVLVELHQAVLHQLTYRAQVQALALQHMDLHQDQAQLEIFH